MLSQQPNPGIKYEYMLPMNDAPIPAVPVIDEHGSGTGPAALTYHHHNTNPRIQSAATLRPSAFVPLHKSPNEPRTSLLVNSNNNNPSNTISSFPKPSPSGSGGQTLFPDESAYSTNLQPQSTHPHLHGHHGRRRGHNNHNNKLNSVVQNSEKRFYWKVTGYTNCTEPCGGGIYN